MTVRFSVTVRQVLEDGTEVPADGEVAAALAGPVEQFAGLAAWAADEARFLDLGEREDVIGQEGRELQRRLLEATFAIDAAREERAARVTSAAGIPHGSVEAGHERGVTSVFGPVRVSRMAYRNRREPNLYPADARWILPGDPYSLGMRALAAHHLAVSGFGQARKEIEDRTGVKVGPAQLTGLAGDLAAWTDDFYEERARDADEGLPGTDVIMMQGDGKGIAMRPEHRKGAGKADTAHPGIKKMAEVVAVADFTPAVREPEDIAAPQARRKAHPGPKARDKWVSASITESIEDMIAAAYGRGRPPQPPARAAAGLPRRREQAADHRHRGPGQGTRHESAGPDRLHPRQTATSARPPRPSTPTTRSPQASGPTGSSSASSTAAPGPSPPPSPPSPREPAPTPASAASTSPPWTRPSPTSRTTASTCATTRPSKRDGPSPPA